MTVSYEKFDLKEVINASGRMTILGVSKVSQAVLAAQQYGGEHFFEMEDYLANGSESGESMKARLVPFIEAVNQIPALQATVVQDSAGREIYRGSVKVTGTISAKEVIRQLKTQNPAIYTREYQANNGIIEFDVRSVNQTEMAKIVQRLREILGE